MGRLEQAKLSPWKGSEQFLSLEASFPIPLPIYLVTLPRQRGIQGKQLLFTASVFCVSICSRSLTMTMATEMIPLALAERLKQFLMGWQDCVGISLHFLCTLWLCLLDFNKCLAKKATQLFVFRFLVRVSYLEIYNEEVRDLLGKDQTQRLEVSLLFWMWCLFWIGEWYCILKTREALKRKWEVGLLSPCTISFKIR